MSKIPQRTLIQITNFVEFGTPPGGFLRAVLTNDLVGAVGHADNENLAALADIVRYVFNEIPGSCWGTDAAVQRWVSEKSSAVKMVD